MKTQRYIVLRTFCHILIIATLLANLVYAGIFIYNKSILTIEGIVTGGKIMTLKTLSIQMLFANGFLSLLAAYSMNIGSKTLMAITMWLLMALNLYTVSTVGYMKVYGVDTVKALLKTNIFSGSLNFILLNTFGGHDFVTAEKMFHQRYDVIVGYFTMFGFVNLGLHLFVTIGLAVGQLVRIREREQAPPTIETALVESVKSLRSERVPVTVAA